MAITTTTAGAEEYQQFKENVVKPINTLGTVRLHDQETKQTILIPTPSNDPNDPLNWSIARRRYNAALVCLAVFLCNFLAAGPSVSIVSITLDFFGPPGPGFVANIGKVAYFFTSTALLQGCAGLIWMPLIIKFGRRPVYLVSFTIYTVAAIWAGVAKSYESELAARIIMGFGAGSGEILGPLTIADIFFLHERGTMMALFTACLSSGVSGGIIISGLITIHHSWRYIYYVAVALIGGLTVLVFFTMPETSFMRDLAQVSIDATHSVVKNGGDEFIETRVEDPKPKRSFLEGLRVYTGVYTSEKFSKLFYRPIVLLILPPVIWATLVMAVTIGFLIAITSNFAQAFSVVYNFQPWQSGLCFISGLIGSVFGVFCGGQVSDLVAQFLTKRNGGIREPEMRLPALTISLVCAPLGLVLYGAGIEKQWHWMVPVIGLGLLSFSIVQATNITLVYTIDCYRPVAGEIIVSQFGFKSAFGFLLSFYTNPWITKSGYFNAFGSMAGISAAIIILWIPFYIYGKRIRHASQHWKIVRTVHWNEDREVGE